MWVLYPPQSRRLRRLRDISDLSLLVLLPLLLSLPPLPPSPSLHLHSSPPLNPNPNPNPPIPTKAVSPEHSPKAHCLRSSVNLITSSLPRLRKFRPRPRPQRRRQQRRRRRMRMIILVDRTLERISVIDMGKGGYIWGGEGGGV